MRYLLSICAATAAVALAISIDHRSHVPARRRSQDAAHYQVYATGRVEGASDAIELRPQLAGAATRVNVQEGQEVQAGDVLIELDNTTYAHQISLAMAEVQLARALHERLVNGAHPQEKAAALADYNAALAEYENAERAWRRIASLHTERVATQQEADDAEARYRAALARMNAAAARLERLKAPAREDDLRAASARLDAANSRLELARAELEKTRLRAPRDGQVLALHVEPGEIAGPQSTQPAIVMVDTSHLQVRAFVEELDAPRVRAGMTAQISVDGLPGKVFTGRVARLAPHMSGKQLFSDAPNERFDTKVREVWIELAETSGLFVGLRVDVMIDPGVADATEGNSNEPAPADQTTPVTGPAVSGTHLAPPLNETLTTPPARLQPINN